MQSLSAVASASRGRRLNEGGYQPPKRQKSRSRLVRARPQIATRRRENAALGDATLAQIRRFLEALSRPRETPNFLVLLSPSSGVWRFGRSNLGAVQSGEPRGLKGAMRDRDRPSDFRSGYRAAASNRDVASSARRRRSINARRSSALECRAWSGRSRSRTLDSTRDQRSSATWPAVRATKQYKAVQKQASFETDHWNFRILREQQHCTQSLLTVRGPLQQDVAVQEAPMPFRESAGHDVPASLGRDWFSVTWRVHLIHSRGARRGTNVKKQQQEGNQNV
jgi:hypothetical protein